MYAVSAVKTFFFTEVCVMILLFSNFPSMLICLLLPFSFYYYLLFTTVIMTLHILYWPLFQRTHPAHMPSLPTRHVHRICPCCPNISTPLFCILSPIPFPLSSQNQLIVFDFLIC